MDICKNELTSPFKIPLKDKEKSKNSPAVTTRSPLADAHDSREFSQRDINAIKMRQKKRIAAEQAQQARDAKKPRKPVDNPVTQDPLAVVDRICGEMAASRIKREQKRDSEERQRHVDNDSALSREALEKHAQDDTMAREVFFRQFIRRESLMERLLGHKMLYGRLESYSSMGYMKTDPPPEAISTRIDPDPDFACTSKPRRGPRTPPPPENSQLPSNDITPQRPKQPRGPKTPPGSPGPRTPPPPQPLQTSSPSVGPAMQSLLANIAAMAGTSGTQLASTLGDDLSRIVGNVNTGVFLESFVTALRSATAQNAVAPSFQTPAVQEKPPQPVTPVRDVSSRSLSRREVDTDSVKMELVSDCSLSPLRPDSQSRTQSPLKAPPAPPLIAPPPPPPILPAPSAPNASTQPPPPAPPMVSFIPIGPHSLPVQNIAMQAPPPLPPPPYAMPPNFASLPPPVPPYPGQVPPMAPPPHTAVSSISALPVSAQIPQMIPPPNINAMPNLSMPPPGVPGQANVAQVVSAHPLPFMTPSRSSDVSATKTSSIAGTPQKPAPDMNVQNSEPPIIRVTIEDTTVNRGQQGTPAKIESRPADNWCNNNCASKFSGNFATRESQQPNRPVPGARFDPPRKPYAVDNSNNDNTQNFPGNDHSANNRGDKRVEIRPDNRPGQDHQKPQNPVPPSMKGSLAPLPSQLTKPMNSPEMTATSQSVTNTLLSALGIGSSSSSGPSKSQPPSFSEQNMKKERSGQSSFLSGNSFGSEPNRLGPLGPAPRCPPGPGPVNSSGPHPRLGFTDSFGSSGPTRVCNSGLPGILGGAPSGAMGGAGIQGPSARMGSPSSPGLPLRGPLVPHSSIAPRGVPAIPPQFRGLPGIPGAHPFRPPNLPNRNIRQNRPHRGSGGRPYRPRE
ncbi:hypothetical protein RB195_007859 [Necator americanus]|uniref:Uncharacterized protein n=1 Tax=Necator americanus TaxID=51031 RepID=A0ABR1BZ91_NECAM